MKKITIILIGLILVSCAASPPPTPPTIEYTHVGNISAITIYKFKDGGSLCYVATEGHYDLITGARSNGVGISCIHVGE